MTVHLTNFTSQATDAGKFNSCPCIWIYHIISQRLNISLQSAYIFIIGNRMQASSLVGILCVHDIGSPTSVLIYSYQKV